ncbi:hypothetical protein B0A50_06021 [Salinomyces thailandicus]|uniref:Uncharacterized protein n=1 Tax=Salinomyces thailandicus TaxID=706561 RepID=A0A4U0TQF8_9PEZI|nr:hypothetical protein B0A50_06021 [Salinomyces thailandica]
MANSRHRSDSEPQRTVAVFPLINGPHPEMAIGIDLPSGASFGALRASCTRSGIALLNASETHWDSAADWVYEETPQRMSTTDASAYAAFLDTIPRQNTWQTWELFEQHIGVGHLEAFGNVWQGLTHRGERRFRRLPVPDADQRPHHGVKPQPRYGCSAGSSQHNTDVPESSPAPGSKGTYMSARTTDGAVDGSESSHPYAPTIEESPEGRSGATGPNSPLAAAIGERAVLLTCEEAELAERALGLYGDV